MELLLAASHPTLDVLVHLVAWPGLDREDHHSVSLNINDYPIASGNPVGPQTAQVVCHRLGHDCGVFETGCFFQFGDHVSYNLAIQFFSERPLDRRCQLNCPGQVQPSCHQE